MARRRQRRTADLLAVNGAVQVQDSPSTGGDGVRFAATRHRQRTNSFAISATAASKTSRSRGTSAQLDRRQPRRRLWRRGQRRRHRRRGQQQRGPGAAAPERDRSAAALGRAACVGAHGSDSLGARVAVTPASGPTRWRRARADGSYASANDPRVLVGLGSASGPVRVRVIWPDGRAEEWRDVPIDRYTTLTEGTGRTP